MKTITITLMVIALIAISVPAYTIDWMKSDDGPRDYRFTSIAVDKNNNKWFARWANMSGVTKFDGNTWEDIIFNLDDVDNLPDVNIIGDDLTSMTNTITSIEADHDGVVWFGSIYGIRSFDGTNWKFHDYRTDDINFNWVYDIAVDKNNVKWFSSLAGLTSYDGKKWTEYNPGTFFCRKLAVDLDGVVWCATAFGLWSFDGTIWTAWGDHKRKFENTQTGEIFYRDPITVEHIIETSPVEANLSVVAVDHDNVKWVGGKDSLWSFDGTTWTDYSNKVKEYAAYPELGVYFYNIVVDRDNIKWTSLNGKLISFDGTSWLEYDQKATGTVDCLAIDHDDVIWMSSSSGVGNLRSLDKRAIPTGVEEEAIIPSLLSIKGNYPNPFNPSTTIEFTLPQAGFADLVIYNMTGQKVRELVSGHLRQGVHSVVWDGRDENGIAVSSGVYISHLKMRDKVTSKQMMLMK